MANVYQFRKNGQGNYGYSVEETKQLFGSENPTMILVSSSLQVVNVWDQNAQRYTDEPSHVTVMVAMEDVEPFTVKLPFANANGERISLGNIKFLDMVSFVNLETYVNGNKVYFRADDIVKVGI